jgi:hypothetical protein
VFENYSLAFSAKLMFNPKTNRNRRDIGYQTCRDRYNRDFSCRFGERYFSGSPGSGAIVLN